jgi:benzoyl-CoA reductase/2-hydroxyglutaryl-CoA dehydratase subunit BcrC/BadD/HgdB
MNTNYGFHADLIMPVKLDTESAEQYMLTVIHKFRKDLEAGLGIRITDAMLQKAVRTSNQVRNHLAALYEIRKASPGKIKSSDLHTIVKASMVMDRDRLADVLGEVVTALEEQRDDTAIKPKRLVLSGGLCSMPDIYDIIESSGGAVVWDDFCTGARYFEGRIDETGDMERNIAQRYMSRIVCPAKHSGIFSRGNYLVEKVKENNADGVIFIFLKFCDPHSFDYPYMKEMLQKEGIPSILFELEEQTSSGGQLRTRCEAFMEML